MEGSASAALLAPGVPAAVAACLGCSLACRLAGNCSPAGPLATVGLGAVDSVRAGCSTTCMSLASSIPPRSEDRIVGCCRRSLNSLPRQLFGHLHQVDGDSQAGLRDKQY